MDENELRKALEARSGEVTPEYRSRLKQALAEPRPAGNDWMAVVAVVVVTLLTATSVGVLVAARHGRYSGPVASAPRVTSPTPEPTPAATPTPAAPGANVQLSVPSANVAFALVDYDSLFRSTDQGDHWVKRSLPSNFGVRPSITFINESEGWLLAPGSPATQCDVQLADIWHTTDGGRTWQDLGARIDKSQCKNGIWFVDSMHGFVTAWDQNHRPTVFRTSDGGDHWAFSTVPDNPIFVTGTGGFTLHVDWMKTFGGTVYLEASGTQHDPTWPQDFIYVSTDGGGTWAWKQKVASRVLVLTTQTRWLELDAPGQLDESVNGGQAMGLYASNIAKDTPVVGAVMVFADPYVGYIAAGGTLQRTLNGGSRWTRLSPPWGPPVPSPSASPTETPIALPTSADLSAPNSNTVWALVQGTRLFVSADRGKTWQERSVPQATSGGTATEISFVDDTNGWLTTCTNSTTLLWKTTDGAMSWHTVSSPFPPDQCLLGLSFVDASRGYITEHFDYAPPAIYTTPDGGETWNGAPIQNPPGYVPGQAGYGFAVLRIVRFGTTYFLAAHGTVPGGDVGWVFRSTDGGLSFTYLGSTPYPADSLAFVTATRWLQVLHPGQTAETIDGGKSWHPYASDYSQAAPIAPQVVFGDASVGYATVRGEIQRTIDGGLHWTSIQTPGVQYTG